MTNIKITCFSCNLAWDVSPPLSRRAECPQCGHDAKVCRNCSHYDQRAYRACREDQAEWVKEKERANYCSYFTIAKPSSQVDSSSLSTAKAKLESLFSSKLSHEPTPKRSIADELEAFLSQRK